MSLPHNVHALLQAEPAAFALLNCGLQGPIGETCLVAAQGRLRVFTRESIVGDFAEAALDASITPGLEPGDFNDTLRVTLADGTDVELAVSSFERPQVQAVLDAAKSPAASPEPQAVAPVAPVEPASAAPIEAAAVAAVPVIAEPSAPAQTMVADNPLKEVKDPQAGKPEARYDSSDIGCVGCLVQTVLFLGATVGLWWAQDPAMIAIGAETGGVLDWVTEILAIVGGLYLGVRLCWLVGKITRAGNWHGQVVVKGDVARFAGPRGAWQVEIDGAKPFEVWLGILVPQGIKPGDNESHSYKYYLRVTQDGRSAGLRCSEVRDDEPTGVAGWRFEKVPKEPNEPQAFLVRDETLVQVAQRLRDLPKFSRRR